MYGLDRAQSAYDRQQHPDYYDDSEHPNDREARIEKEAAEEIKDKRSRYYALQHDNVIEAVMESESVFSKKLADLLEAKNYEAVGKLVEQRTNEYWTKYVTDLNA